jgi:DNA polymerase-1
MPLPQSGTLPTETPTTDFGPGKYGAVLFIDSKFGCPRTTIALDIETDEADNFVGLALCRSDNAVYYFTNLADIKDVLENNDFVGHNLKGDLHWLRKWGININASQLQHDTMIASYVVKPSRLSHGLKSISQELLNLIWPTYADIVGKGRSRVTLDKQPVSRVARYCGMDALATWKLHNYFQRTMTPNQRRVYQGIEMPVNRVLFQMEELGVLVDMKKLSDLDVQFKDKLEQIRACVRELSDQMIKDLIPKYEKTKLAKWGMSAMKAFNENGHFNPASSQQKRMLLTYLGYDVKNSRKQTLAKFKGNKLIDLLLEHSEFAKLYSSFIKGFNALGTLPLIHTTYSQVSESANNEDDMHGIRTGRLSSKHPNLQQIPSRTENGKLLRTMFIPRDGKTMVCADYSQIELRLAAHFSHDPILTKAFKNGEDIHEATAKALGVDRFLGKQGNFLLAFGGHYKKLMDVLALEEKAAIDFYNLYWRNFKVLGSWKRPTGGKSPYHRRH